MKLERGMIVRALTNSLPGIVQGGIYNVVDVNGGITFQGIDGRINVQEGDFEDAYQNATPVPLQVVKNVVETPVVETPVDTTPGAMAKILNFFKGK